MFAKGKAAKRGVEQPYGRIGGFAFLGTLRLGHISHNARQKSIAVAARMHY
jgi:hypothetical protein